MQETTVVFLGHVDHGKSTLIGRLLFDTKQIMEDKVEFARNRSAEQGRDLEFAFLLDGFEEEQSQGITIDFTQTRFFTEDRQFILADAPGHREFLKNMLCGASRADAAFLLIDATEGVRDQSRSHAYLLSLLGVQQLAVVINKMDLIGWNETEYRRIVSEYELFLDTIDFSAATFIPAAAYHGDNIACKSKRMDWYHGPTVLEQLDRFFPPRQELASELLLPVQDVYRFGQRRIIAGKIESGNLRVGDSVMVWPTRETGTVKSIDQWPKTDLTFAACHQNVGVEFRESLFVERGMVLTALQHVPQVSRGFVARLVWLGRFPLQKSQRYKLKTGCQETTVWLERIDRIIDIGKLEDIKAESVSAGFVVEGLFVTDQPIVFEQWQKYPTLGRFVLVDQYQISGGGVFLESADYQPVKFFSHHEEQQRIFPTQGAITRENRQNKNGHNSFAIWLTGLSGAGKTTLARKLEESLFALDFHVYVLDGDNLRNGLTKDLGFSSQDRRENIRRVAETARLFVDAGMIVITALISPYEADREMARSLFADTDFVEVYLRCPLEVCETRDPKGLYQRARNKEIQQFTGIDDAYQEPASAEVTVDTNLLTVEECVEMVFNTLKSRRQLKNIDN